jgi:hypothetical protein
VIVGEGCGGACGGGPGHVGFANCEYVPFTLPEELCVSVLERLMSRLSSGGLGLPRMAERMEYSRLVASELKG